MILPDALAMMGSLDLVIPTSTDEAPSSNISSDRAGLGSDSCSTSSASAHFVGANAAYLVLASARGRDVFNAGRTQ